jgi:hypothetical protein
MIHWLDDCHDWVLLLQATHSYLTQHVGLFSGMFQAVEPEADVAAEDDCDQWVEHSGVECYRPARQSPATPSGCDEAYHEEYDSEHDECRVAADSNRDECYADCEKGE